MRTVHRLCAIIVFVGLLFMAVTGSSLQVIELNALLHHEPETALVIRAINEGRYGNDQYPVISSVDFTAAALPENTNYEQSMANVLKAFHAQQPGVAPDLIELRVANGAPIGQVAVGKQFSAFDAETGTVVEPVKLPSAGPPPQLHETLKEWHRIWVGHHVWGFWLELLLGLSLGTLLVTGLVVYYRLLRARTKIGRGQLFWVAGGWWRSLHRMVSVVAGVFLAGVAFSGTWLGFESVWHGAEVSVTNTWLDVTHSTAPRATMRIPPPPTISLTDSDIPEMTAQTLSAFRRDEPNTPIKAIRLRYYADMKQGVVIASDPNTRQHVYNTATGRTVSLSEPGYPKTNFPFGTQVHENIKHFHSGELLGLTARWMDLLAGLSLIYLSISGLIMYFELWNKRRKSGRGGFFWT